MFELSSLKAISIGSVLFTVYTYIHNSLVLKVFFAYFMNRKKKKNHTNYYTMNRIGETLNPESLGTAPAFLKLYLWSPGASFIPIISTEGINQIKKGKL